MEKTKMTYENSAQFFLEIFKQHYEKDNNPIHLMKAFTEAFRYKLDIPIWVIRRLDEVFQEYLYSENEESKAEPSLDELMGCKRGRGRDTARQELERYDRDLRLVMDVDILERHGMKVRDAALVSREHNSNLFPPGHEKVRQMYYHWKDRLAKINQYSKFKLPEILKSAPEEIRKKYPDLF